MTFLVVSIFLVTLFVISNAQSNTKVREYVWVNDPVTEKYKTSVYVAPGSSLYDVMVKAALEGHAFEFEEDGSVVTKIGENEQDAANNRRWLIYVSDKAPVKTSPPGANQLSSLDIRSIIVENGKHYLFWLKTDN